MTPIIPNLGLKFLTDTKLLEYGQDKINKINAAPAFAAVVPSTLTVAAKRTQFETALVAADNGTVAATALKDQYRLELEELLTAQAIDCARISAGNMPLYLATGYKAKDVKGSPSGQLPAVIGIQVFYGDNSGDLKIKFLPLKGAANYTIQVFSDVTNPSGSVIKEVITGKIGKLTAVIAGLPSGQLVFVRIRANGGSSGTGPWSNISEKRVP